LNKLYVKKFGKIPMYDEEEEKTVQPKFENGYFFELNMNSLFRSVKQARFLKINPNLDIFKLS
jgi:hypothetical protein